MTEPFQVYSIGFTCQQLQLPIAKIRATADRLGIRASSINGVAHFSESDVELIREAHRKEMQLHESHVLSHRSKKP